MRPPRITIALGLLVLATAIVRADKITFDYDHKATFSKYKTFMWVQDPEPKEPFMKERIIAAVNAQLQLKGLRLVNDGADLLVGANIATDEKHTWETYYSGSDWGWGGGWSTTEEKTYDVGTLVVDLFDAHTKKLVWEGTAIDTLPNKPAKRTKEYGKHVEKMFRYYPPGIEVQSEFTKQHS